MKLKLSKKDYVFFERVHDTIQGLQMTDESPEVIIVNPVTYQKLVHAQPMIAGIDYTKKMPFISLFGVKIFTSEEAEIGTMIIK